MIDYFKEAEKLMLEYPTLQLSIQNLKERKAALEKIVPARQPRTEKKKRQLAQLSKAEEIWLDRQQVDKQIKHTSAVVKHIEQVLEQLDSEERVVLHSWYIAHKPKEKILEELHVESLATLYNIRNKAVRRFAMLFFGASFFE